MWVNASLFFVRIVTKVNTNTITVCISHGNWSRLTVDFCLHRHVCVIWQSLPQPLALKLRQYLQFYWHWSLDSDWLLLGQLTSDVHGSPSNCPVMKNESGESSVFAVTILSNLWMLIFITLSLEFNFFLFIVAVYRRCQLLNSTGEVLFLSRWAEKCKFVLNYYNYFELYTDLFDKAFSGVCHASMCGCFVLFFFTISIKIWVIVKWGLNDNDTMHTERTRAHFYLLL